MAEMGYNRNVSSGSSTVAIPNVTFSGLDSTYNKKSVAKPQSTIYNSTDSSLDLSIFLTDNIDENCNTEAISADQARHYDSYSGKEWYEYLGDALACTGATVVNTTMGLLEGVAELAEGLIDTGLVVTSITTIGLPLLVADAVNFVGSKLLGREFNSLTEAYWTDVLMPIVGYDASGKAFEALYSTNVMSTINDHSLDTMKRGGTGYNIAKNVGYVTGTVAIGVFTGGLGTVGMTASTASTLTSGLAKAGNTFESKYNKLSEEEKQDMGKIGQVLLNGALTGGVEAGMWYLTYGNGLDKIAGKFGKGAPDFLNQTVIKLSGNNTFTQMVAKVFPNAIKTSSLFKGGLQFLKPFATLGIDASTLGLKIDENTKLSDYFLNATIEGLANAVVAIGYDASFLKNIVEGTSAKVSTSVSGKTDYLYTGNSQLSQNALGIENAGLGNQTIYSSLTEAISKYIYTPTTIDGGTAHFTRVLFEGLKKSGGNIVKKNISVPLIQGVKNIINWSASALGAIYNK